MLDNEQRGFVNQAVRAADGWLSDLEREALIYDLCEELGESIPEYVVRDEFKRQARVRCGREQRSGMKRVGLQVRLMQRLLHKGVGAISRLGDGVSVNGKACVYSFSRAQRSWIISQPEVDGLQKRKWLCWTDRKTGRCWAKRIPVGIKTDRDAALFLRNMATRKVLIHPAAMQGRQPVHQGNAGFC